MDKKSDKISKKSQTKYDNQLQLHAICLVIMTELHNKYCILGILEVWRCAI